MTGSALACGGLNATLAGCSGAQAADSSMWSSTANPPVSAQTSKGIQVRGYCAPAYRPVFDAFVANFEHRQEIGASVAMTVKGVPVLDAWGGHSDALAPTPSVPWNEDTVSLVFSCTKGATALCAHHLIANGQLDLDRPVAHYWPEFAAQGKSAVTVRMLLQHASGVAAIPFSMPVPMGAWADWTEMCARIAASPPWWQPGTAHGYHAVTFGWLVGEVVRRVSGLSLGTYFQTHIAGPLGIDFWIGTPTAQLSRVSPLHEATEVLAVDPFTQTARSDPASLQAAVFNLGGWFESAAYNSTASLQAEIPGTNGVTNARGLATLYAALANGGALGTTRLLPADYTATLGMIHSALPIDRTLLVAIRCGLGFHGPIDNRATGPGLSVVWGANAYGHCGFGGSVGFADPQSEMSFGYTMNRMGPGILLNERGQSLIDAAYGSLGYTTNRYGAWVRVG